MNKLLFAAMVICLCGCYNVDKQTIDAMVNVNHSLIDAKKVVEENNREIHGWLERALADDRIKVQPYYNKAIRVIRLSDTLVQQLQNLKIELAKEAGGTNNYKDDSIEFIENKVAVTQCNNILLDGNHTNAQAIKTAFSKYRKVLIESVDPKDSGWLGIGLLMPNHTSSSGETLSWEDHTFKNKPLVANIETLTRLQVDVRNCEAKITWYLYESTASSSFFHYYTIYFDRFFERKVGAT